MAPLQLGLFFMPVHRPEKPWSVALEEDRQATILADQCGYAEVWMGEHFSTKVEQVPAPLMFFATLVHETQQIKFGTGVINLGHRHPLVVAAEAAQFDQLSNGRLLLGLGPGGLPSDGELFGRADMAERVEAAAESINMLLALWRERAPFDLDGQYWRASLKDQVWLDHGVGELCRPLQEPHPPIAMAMVSPGGATAELIATRDFIPISANFVPLSVIKAQWASYSGKREALGKRVDPAIWRVCRNILITESDAQAQELIDDPDGPFSFYFRYLRGLREMHAIRDMQEPTAERLNDFLKVEDSIEQCVVSGSVDTVTAQLMEMVDYLGPFGTLVSVGHDWDGTDLWRDSITQLATEVKPRLARHMATLGA
jgi:alkanesulfonate monooxygenase SsuD/methylene tetrahydromethanopterin reductase-like flavin-dependent oxidoreductase (luciferase family)